MEQMGKSGDIQNLLRPLSVGDFQGCGQGTPGLGILDDSTTLSVVDYERCC